jgi:hypothetical protein
VLRERGEDEPAFERLLWQAEKVWTRYKHKGIPFVTKGDGIAVPRSVSYPT